MHILGHAPQTPPIFNKRHNPTRSLGHIDFLSYMQYNQSSAVVVRVTLFECKPGYRLVHVGGVQHLYAASPPPSAPYLHPWVKADLNDSTPFLFPLNLSIRLHNRRTFCTLLLACFTKESPVLRSDS